MKIEDNTIFFKSDEHFFHLEKAGKKPNTVRIMEYPDYKDMANDEAQIKRIRITNRYVEKDTPESFERTLTDISYAGEILGHVIMVFSWRHEVFVFEEEEEEEK